MRYFFFSLALLAAADVALAAPEVPGKPQERPIALVGATVHTVSGADIENATLLFDDGKIVAIEQKVNLPGNTEVIDVKDKHIYPSLIDAFTNVGLVEIESVRATRDQAETGSINPNAKAQIAFNPDSELIPVGRSNGVLVLLSAPTGGLISGTSAVMQLDGWTWEEMTLKGAAGVHISWPRTTPVREFASVEPDPIDQDKRKSAIDNIRQAFADARAYYQAKKAASPGQDEPKFDARWESMIPLFDGKLPIIVQADEIQQIQAAVAFAAKEQVKLILLGGYDAPHCTELLKQHDVPVIIAGVHRLPQRNGEPYDHPFTVPRRLHEAGIRFCISGAENPWSVRNLPYHAGTAAAHGLSKDEALKAVTLYPAQILGVDDRVGSLDTGKEATLLVTDGDVLEIPTQVEMAYIQGRKVDLSDRHKRLWEKYKEKYRRQGIEN
jgi:imidazolonepropionase-like amidohydrolase